MNMLIVKFALKLGDKWLLNGQIKEYNFYSQNCSGCQNSVMTLSLYINKFIIYELILTNKGSKWSEEWAFN